MRLSIIAFAAATSAREGYNQGRLEGGKSMHFSRVFEITAGAVLTMTFLAGQRAGVPPTSAAGSMGNTTTSGANTTGGLGNTGTLGGNTSSTNSPFPAGTTRPIYITGKVMLNDGTAPSEFVLIERVCGGSAHPETHTDSKGHFSFNLGQAPDTLADASETNSPMARNRQGTSSVGPGQLMNCELRAVLPGFRSDTVSLSGQHYMDNPDIGTIVLHRLANVEGLTMSATSAMAPKESRKAYEKGLEAAKKGKPDEAQKEFEKAVETYPKYASAWFELGKIYEQRDHVEEARKAYSQALAADSKFINPYERLYVMAVKEAKWQEVADTTDHVMRLNPYDFPNAYYFNAVANLQLGKLDVAEKSARQAVELDKGHRNPRADYILGIVLAQQGKFTESTEHLRAYLKAAPEAADAETVRKQLAQAEQSAQASARPAEPQN
jgi:tetratricopeptide (TPR) repeat protein